MTETTTRNLADLVAATGVSLSPTAVTLAELEEMDRKHENLTIWGVTLETTEEFGDKYTYDIERSNGERRLLSLWSNPQRDATALALMQLCNDGPVSGVAIVNAGGGNKPFWLIQPL